MTNEEFEARKRFLLEQRAQFAAGMPQLRELQAQTESIVGRLAIGTLERNDDVNGKINALVDSQINLSEAQSRTDESLRNLIAVVDRYFTEGRNGN